MRWKAVKGYEGIYEVSDTGKVRTVEGKVTFSSLHGKRVWKQRELKQKLDKHGYKRVCLYKDKKPKDFLVHRLVADAFCEKEPGKDIINHVDCDPGNNHYKNLVWCDHRENLIHAYKNKLNQAPKGILLICKETKKESEFYSMAEASRYLGRNPGYISAVLKRGENEIKTHLIKVV